MSTIAYHSRTAVLLLTALFVVAGTFGAFASTARAADPPPSTSPPSKEVTKSPTPPGAELPSPGLFGEIMTWIAGLFAWLLGAAIVILDYTVYYTVVTMDKIVHGLAAIGVSWRILRDIGNIFLIFGFVAVGVTTILSVDWYGGGTKMLPMLLVAAVFLNFSLFISQAVIDVGNLFATEFFVQINGGKFPDSAMSRDFNTAAKTEGISNAIMGAVGLQSIYSEVRTNSAASKDLGKATSAQLFNDNPFYIGFMAILLFLVAAFVMFSLAFILIARFVALIFLMVVAPIGFAGLAVPKLAGIAKMWWGQLFEQTITAPVLLLLLYVALAVITDARFLVGFGGTSPSYTGGIADPTPVTVANFGSILFSFLVAMGLLLAVVIIAKRMSAFGGTMATRMGGRLSFGAVSWGGRLAIGGAGVALASKRMQGWATPKKDETGIRRYMRYALRPAVFTGKGLRAVKYDPRSKYGLGAGLGALGIDAGAEAKMTPQQLDEARRRYQPGMLGLKEGQFWKESRAEYQAAGTERDFRVAERELGYLKADLDAGRITRAQYDTAAEGHEKVIAGGLSKMSTKQLEELGGIKQGVEALVKNLSPDQLEAVMKSDQITGDEKEKIRLARESGLKTLYANTAEYQNPATHPTAPGATRVSQNPIIVAAAAAAGTPTPNMSRGEQAVRALSRERASKLQDSVLRQSDVYQNLSLQQITAIQNAGTLNPTDAAAIGGWLNAPPPGALATDVRQQFVTYIAGLNAAQRIVARAFWGV